jgi:hypothetical protein
VPEIRGQGESFAAAFRAAVKAVSLGPARASYRAKSPRAQFRQLERTAAGRRALELAGAGGNRRTRAAWLTGARTPSKANAAAIGRAYGAMQLGGIPEWVRGGKMEIRGRVNHGGRDERDRGAGGSAPLRVNLAGGNGTPHDSGAYPQDSVWDAIRDHLDDDDDDLGELIGEELLPADDDLGGYSWGFPGGGYTVVITS